MMDPMGTTHRYIRAFEAIRKEATENTEAVEALSKQLMLLILQEHVPSMTLMAALYALAVSGAQLVQSLEGEEVGQPA